MSAPCNDTEGGSGEQLKDCLNREFGVESIVEDIHSKLAALKIVDMETLALTDDCDLNELCSELQLSCANKIKFKALVRKHTSSFAKQPFITISKSERKALDKVEHTFRKCQSVHQILECYAGEIEQHSSHTKQEIGRQFTEIIQTLQARHQSLLHQIDDWAANKTQQTQEAIDAMQNYSKSLNECAHDMNNVIATTKSMSDEREMKIDAMARKTCDDNKHFQTLNSEGKLRTFIERHTSLIDVDIPSMLWRRNLKEIGSLNAIVANDKYAIPHIFINRVSKASNADNDKNAFRVTLDWTVGSDDSPPDSCHVLVPEHGNKVDITARCVGLWVEYHQASESEDTPSWIAADSTTREYVSSSPRAYCATLDADFKYDTKYTFRVCRKICSPVSMTIASDSKSYLAFDPAHFTTAWQKSSQRNDDSESHNNDDNDEAEKPFSWSRQSVFWEESNLNSTSRSQSPNATTTVDSSPGECFLMCPRKESEMRIANAQQLNGATDKTTVDAAVNALFENTDAKPQVLPQSNFGSKPTTTTTQSWTTSSTTQVAWPTAQETQSQTAATFNNFNSNDSWTQLQASQPQSAWPASSTTTTGVNMKPTLNAVPTPVPSHNAVSPLETMNDIISKNDKLLQSLLQQSQWTQFKQKTQSLKSEYQSNAEWHRLQSVLKKYAKQYRTVIRDELASLIASPKNWRALHAFHAQWHRPEADIVANAVMKIKQDWFRFQQHDRVYYRRLKYAVTRVEWHQLNEAPKLILGAVIDGDHSKSTVVTLDMFDAEIVPESEFERQQKLEQERARKHREQLEKTEREPREQQRVVQLESNLDSTSLSVSFVASDIEKEPGVHAAADLPSKSTGSAQQHRQHVSISDTIDTEKEEIVFEADSCSSKRLDSDMQKWRGRGRGVLRIYWHSEAQMAKIIFTDTKHRKSRLLQWIDSDKCATYLHPTVHRPFNPCVEWQANDYTMDQKCPIYASWRMFFLNKDKAEQFTAVYNKYIASAQSSQLNAREDQQEPQTKEDLYVDDDEKHAQ